MDRISRTNDQVLDSLIERIERHIGAKVKQSEINPYRKNPYLLHLALTHIEYTTARIDARSGAITDDTLLNPRIHDKIVNCIARVGTSAGQGIGYNQESVPVKQRMNSLEKRINLILDEAFNSAADSYDEFVSASRRDNSTMVPNLVKIEPTPYLGKVKEKRMPIDKLRRVARVCSKILSSNGDDDCVTIDVHDEVRRLVTSDGIVIRDGFFGYKFYMTVKTRDEKLSSPMSFSQSLYFTDEDIGGSEKSIINHAKWMLKEIEKRKKCERKITNGIYPVLLYQGAMATQLHECFVHFLASDEILYNKSTTLGWENFGKMCTNPYMTVYSNPGMPGKWGSMEFDHEGVPAQQRLLVETGKVIGYLADRDGAYHLSRLTGKPILPGDARIAFPREGENPSSHPRISNLEIEYSEQRMAASRKQMFNRFVNYLRKNKFKEGIFIPDSSCAECYTEDGRIITYPNFPYVVSTNGNLTPAKFITTRSDVHTFLNNIVTMGGPREYIPHICGIGDEESTMWVRAGILCGTGIVRDMHIYAERPEELRQPRFK